MGIKYSAWKSRLAVTVTKTICGEQNVQPTQSVSLAVI